jgi:hypothetical protein
LHRRRISLRAGNYSCLHWARRGRSQWRQSYSGHQPRWPLRGFKFSGDEPGATPIPELLARHRHPSVIPARHLLRRGRRLRSGDFSCHSCVRIAALINIDSAGVQNAFVYGLELLCRLHLFEGVVGRAYERARLNVTKTHILAELLILGEFPRFNEADHR